MWIAEGIAVGALVWLMASVPQFLYRSLQAYERLMLALSFALYVGVAVLANGLKFYGVIPIGGKE